MKRHGTDIVSLVFGLVFVSLAGWWVLGHFVHLTVRIPHLGWLTAGILILVGLLGVAASLRRDRMSSAVEPAGPIASTTVEPPRHEPAEHAAEPSDAAEPH
jgi:hypothetical protein